MHERVVHPREWTMFGTTCIAHTHWPKCRDQLSIIPPNYTSFSLNSSKVNVKKWMKIRLTLINNWNKWTKIYIIKQLFCGIKYETRIIAMVCFWQVQRTQCRQLFVAEFWIEIECSVQTAVSLSRLNTHAFLTHSNLYSIAHSFVWYSSTSTHHIHLGACACECIGIRSCFARPSMVSFSLFSF